MILNHPAGASDLSALKARATSLRRHMLSMAKGQGQGYIGQGLGIADALAALYFHEMRHDPADLDPWVAASIGALLSIWVTFVPPSSSSSSVHRTSIASAATSPKRSPASPRPSARCHNR